MVFPSKKRLPIIFIAKICGYYSSRSEIRFSRRRNGELPSSIKLEAEESNWLTIFRTNYYVKYSIESDGCEWHVVRIFL